MVVNAGRRTAHDIDDDARIVECGTVSTTPNIEPIPVSRRVGILRRLVTLGIAAAVLFGSGAALADGRDRSGGCRLLGDDPNGLAADANLDLYNGLFFAAVGAGVSFGGEPAQQWSNVNNFDDEARGALRGSTAGSRRRADLASDLTLVASLGLMPTLSIGVQYARTGDCAESWDMATDLAESFGLALALTESIKLASGRERPFAKFCGPSAPSDASCRGGDRFRSFVSGHAAFAATGAGLTCAWSVRRRAWGDGLAARAAPCGLGMGLALATAGLRVNADRHWMTDVIAGFAIGSAVGWFDTWGPFDLLRFGEDDRGGSGRPAFFGFVVPGVVEGAPGVRGAFVF